MLAIRKKGHKYEWFGRQHTVWYVCKSQKDKTLRYCEAWADINVFLEYSQTEIMIMMQSLRHQPVWLNGQLSNPWGIPKKKNILPSSSPFLSLCSFLFSFCLPRPYPATYRGTCQLTQQSGIIKDTHCKPPTPLPSLLLLDLWPYLWSGWDEWREWNSRCPFDISSIKGGIVRASKCTTTALCISHTNLLRRRINSGQS